MLTIKRVATVVSINQVSEQICGRNCLGSCCMPGAKLPLYTFVRRKVKTSLSDGAARPVLDGHAGSTASEQISLLDLLIYSKWEECLGRGLFRYDVTTCETKTLEGESGFVAQLNEGRHSKKRPTEFRIDQVLQPFDRNKFNFTKVGQQEVLFRFEESEDGTSGYDENASIHGSCSPNVVAINVSPIEYGHVLLVPRVMDCIPQRIDPDTFLLALHMAAEANNPYFRFGYNSLGAFATINHLHFQAYYLNSPFAIERAPTTRVAHRHLEFGLRISELAEYPVRGLVYEVGSSLDELAAVVSKACMALQESNIPFNTLITDCGARVFLVPQCFAERQAKGDVQQVVLDTQVNPAVWEISGHIVLKRKEDYEMATEDYAWKLLAEVSLCKDRFEVVKEMCVKASEGKLIDCDDTSAEEEAVKAAVRNLSKFKTKTKKSLDIEVLYTDCIVPRA